MRTKKGTVTSAKMDKTIVVTVYSFKEHPKYKKKYKVKNKFYAHDENNTSKEGDVVVIREMRPLSRLKRWELVETVKRSEDTENL